MMQRVALLFLLALAASASAIELTSENYKALTAGKSVFLKFYAPWCGHCKKLKPDWDKLMATFAGDAARLVADIDCTSDGGKPLCEKNSVDGYPVLKWGSDPAHLVDYQYARDLETMTRFAKTGLLQPPECTLSNLDLCDDGEKAQIEEFSVLPEKELEKKVAAREQIREVRLKDARERYEKGVSALNTFNTALEKKRDVAINTGVWNPAEDQAKFEGDVDTLKTRYTELNEEKVRVVAEIRADGLGLLKSVLASKKPLHDEDGSCTDNSDSSRPIKQLPS